MSTSNPYTSAQIKAFARNQLETHEVPSTYLTQLREHLSIFPNDHLFRLRPFAGASKYGAIDCLEPGCGVSDISLHARESVADGGRALGIGGLAAFQSHIRDSELHRAFRAGRIQTENGKRGQSDSSGSNDMSRFGREGKAREQSCSASSKRSSSVVTDDDDLDSKRQRRSTSPIVIDSDPESDIAQAVSTTAVSPEDVDYIWLDGQGLVPLVDVMAQTAITGHGYRHHQHDVKPKASSSQRLLSPMPSTSKPTNLLSRAQISSQLKEANESQANYSSALKEAMSKADWNAVRALRDQINESQRKIDLLKKQLEEAPNTNDPSPPWLSSSISSSGIKPNVLASGSKAGSPFADNSTPVVPRVARTYRYNMGQPPPQSSSDRDSVVSDRRSVSPEPDDVDPFDFGEAWAERNAPPEMALAHMTDAERDEFYKKALINLDFETNVTVADAKKLLNIPEGPEALMPGLSVPLYPHQVIGIAWMLEQEKGSHRGGMLADEMGLGKTVQMIGTMTANPTQETRRKTTLIVAPLALTSQWKKEIERKSTIQFKILLYYGNNRPSKKTLQQYDIVITTYGLLNAEWADDKAALKALANPDKTPPRRSKSGTLFGVEWYRIVLDESQTIRNPNAKISRAVYDLQSLYRWSLTGTPIFNRLLDIYPQLRFLKIRPYNDIGEFRNRISRHEKKRPNLAGQRAQATLKTFMMRRQKSSKLDGKPLISLPTKNIDAIMLDLSPEERHLYDCIESRMQAKFNKFLKAGTVLKNYAHILVMLLRLRQACGHIALCTEKSDEEHVTMSRDDPEQELKRAISKMGQDWVDKVMDKCQVELDELAAAEKDDPAAAVPECPICSEALDDTARITKCMHTFCADCIEQIMNHDDHADAIHDRMHDPDKTERPCPNCRAPFKRPDTYLRQAFMPEKPAEDEDDESDEEGGVRIAYKKRNNVVADSDDDLSDDILENSKGKGKQKVAPKYVVEPSTKIVWLLEELKTIRRESPDDKLIIISQWVSLLDLVAACLESNGHRFVRYQGNMGPAERVEAVEKFEEDSETPMMLMSLKCGGVGLNLTRGNRVISLDLAWSPATEAQAFDRVHRLGQNKEVFVKRIMINNSVEQRMLDLQEKKRNITENALGEGGKKRLTRMTVAQLANLFNLDVEGNELT